MIKFLKIAGLVITGMIVGMLILANVSPKQNVGGVYNTVKGYFPQGIEAGNVNFTNPKVTPAADGTLSISQSGTTFLLNSGIDLILPAVAISNGVFYRFVTPAAITASTTVSSAEGDNLEGSLIVAGAVANCDAADKVTLDDSTENIGDYFSLFSDGTYWYIGDSGTLTAASAACSG